MSVTSILPHLYQIVIPTPFRVGPVNVYLATDPDGPLTLIDTGPCTEEARAAMERALAAFGYALSDIGRIIITHAHSDHYGLAGEIVQASGASVFSHPHNQPTLEDYVGERERRGAFFIGLLTEAGVPQDIREKVIETLAGYRQFASAVSPIEPLSDGEEIRLAEQQWHVELMPGHSGGLICLYQPETRLFLSNDHLLRDISSNPLFEPPLPGQNRRRRSLVDYVDSLERTAKMDVAVAWPGHGEPIHDHRALIANRLDFHRRRADRLDAVLADGPQTVYALSLALFKELTPMDRFLAISEILAHLEWLEDQGLLTCQTGDGLALWRRSDNRLAIGQTAGRG